ncbi:unnamed protein product, partial [Didymodactylos carnosus]
IKKQHKTQQQSFTSIRMPLSVTTNIDKKPEDSVFKVPMSPITKSQPSSSNSVTAKPYPKARKITRKTASLVYKENTPIIISTPKHLLSNPHRRCYKKYDFFADDSDSN